MASPIFYIPQKGKPQQLSEMDVQIYEARLRQQERDNLIEKLELLIGREQINPLLRGEDIDVSDAAAQQFMHLIPEVQKVFAFGEQI